LLNLGEFIAKPLCRVGIKIRDDLRRLGAVEALDFCGFLKSKQQPGHGAMASWRAQRWCALDDP
jgi:hypothetical protein